MAVKKKSPRPGMIVITPGDPEGIGPEIVWKTLRSLRGAGKKPALLCVGAESPFKKLGAPIIRTSFQALEDGEPPPHSSKPFIWLLPAPARTEKLLAGFQTGWSIETATRLVLKGIAQALVTGPISKERLQAGGYLYPGHTEFLAKLCGTRKVTMMLANDILRISLVTTHLALKDVPAAVTSNEIKRTVSHTLEYLRNWWRISRPRIAVAALNPHAGESGLFGKEEIRVIEPAIRQIRQSAKGRFVIDGPLPSDTLFAKQAWGRGPRDRYDAVVCMYHDQGLIPVKLLDFPHTVNVTLGLPIIRTSVDHGVGFDIAGKGIADPSSFRSALELATRLSFT